MRFPLSEQLNLPCTFAHIVPGRAHPDGRRYLPLIVLRPAAAQPVGDRPVVTALGVVDRHHVVDLGLKGRAGVARLVFLLSSVSLQVAGRAWAWRPRMGWRKDAPAQRRSRMAVS